MAKNIKINGITYQGVPSVSIPLSDGSGKATFSDTSDATIDASKVLSGYTGYGSGGTKITGTLTTVSVSQDATTKIVTVS